MDQSMVLNFFGGVSQDGFSLAVNFDKVLYELARWLLPIGICLLAEGIWLEKWRKIEPLACYRYAAVKIWWRRKYVRSLLYGILAAAVLFIPAMAVDILSASGFWKDGWKALLLWLVHMITILSFFLLLDRIRQRKLAPAVLLLLEGVTFLAGFSNMRIARFMYGMWGMYFQSEWYFEETGISVLSSLSVETALIVFGYLAGGILLEGKMRNSQRRTAAY